MYHNRYERAKSIYDDNYKILMTDKLEYSYNNLVRWYDPYELKIVSNCSNYDNLLSHFGRVKAPSFSWQLQHFLFKMWP